MTYNTPLPISGRDPDSVPFEERIAELAEADRLQIARHNRERDGYRNRLGEQPQRAPSETEMRQRRESYPERRRIATEQAIAALFRERPEYRVRRVGQITARLVHYIGADFPSGKLGVPKDHEVEAILDGELRDRSDQTG